MRVKKQISTFQIILAGFLLAIVTGTLLLMLPAATRGEGGAPLSDALFTATSAVCVTGLVVRDTAANWSLFGQVVLLVLIQIGGMGVVTVAVTTVMLSGRRIGLMQRSALQDALAAPSMGGIVRLTGFIVAGTALFELLGAALMAPEFCRAFGLWPGLFRAVFHSVSAFCNAGFDLMGADAPFSSFTAYTGQPLINCVIMALIVAGGLGFMTWDDIKTHGLHWKRYRMQSKVILTVTPVLILLPALFFYLHAFAALPAGERILASVFQSVTMRTAGFNTVDLTAVDGPTQGVMMVLMLIGGAPGSTAGGMKVTTLAVLAVSAVAVYRRKDGANCFGRRLPEEAIRSAAAILLLYLTLFFAGGSAISCIEGLPLSACLFESASAIGTVGVSLGVTARVGLASRLILTGMMFCGRVGGLTLFFATVAGTPANLSKLPVEKIAVG